MTKRISNDKTKTENENNYDGVYRLDYEHSDVTYTGETGRKFMKRTEEHERYQELRNDKLQFGTEHKHGNEEVTDKYKILTVERNIKIIKLWTGWNHY